MFGSHPTTQKTSAWQYLAIVPIGFCLGVAWTIAYCAAFVGVLVRDIRELGSPFRK
jgi:ABC-type polysaccharide/polyol phosphate export permease